jgi:glycosyltransferase involved in cell wall biosynthesis
VDIIPFPTAEAERRGGASRLSVVISTFERPGHLRRCLASIAAQTDVADAIEVVVTDDGSRDHTPAVVASFARQVSFRVALTSHRHDGFRLSQCRNEGAAAATSDRFLFTDGDCLLPPGTLAAYLHAIRPGRIAGGDSCRLDEAATAALTDDDIRSGQVLGAVTPAERRRMMAKARRARIYEALRLSMRPRIHGNAIGIARGDYESLNGFDEAFVGWGLEDVDLQLRAEKRGIRVQGMFQHAFVHQWHPVDPTWAENGGSHSAHRYLRRPDVSPACRLGFDQRAADTAIAFDSRPSIVRLPAPRWRLRAA